MFNHHLAKMHEAGVLSMLDTKWMSPERPQTPVNPNQVFTSLGGDMLFFPFSFLFLHFSFLSFPDALFPKV